MLNMSPMTYKVVCQVTDTRETAPFFAFFQVVLNQLIVLFPLREMLKSLASSTPRISAKWSVSQRVLIPFLMSSVIFRWAEKICFNWLGPTIRPVDCGAGSETQEEKESKDRLEVGVASGYLNCSTSRIRITARLCQNHHHNTIF